MDIVEQLRKYQCPENKGCNPVVEYCQCALMDSSADEIERLRDLVKKWQALEKEAAMYVEGVICMRSAHFTGEEPYVGWLGLGRALTKDYDDMKRMRGALQNIASKNPFHNQCPPAGDTNYYGKLIVEMVVIANAALKD
jgi:hypothetical protein